MRSISLLKAASFIKKRRRQQTTPPISVPALITSLQNDWGSGGGGGGGVGAAANSWRAVMTSPLIVRGSFLPIFHQPYRPKDVSLSLS